MYERFAGLCENANVTPYRVAKDCGFSNVTLSDWKNGKSRPKLDKLKKIAEYFGVSVDYFSEDKEKMFSDDNAHLVALLRNDAEMTAALLKYVKMTEQKKKQVREYIEFMYRQQ